MNNQWNPDQYEKFKAQRAKPFLDLLGLVERGPFTNAIDLGCGTGELTRTLFDTLKPVSLVGVDSSPEMLARADKFKTEGLDFLHADIGDFANGMGLTAAGPNGFAPEASREYDLIFSNAALQWVPDHETLFPKILKRVSANGQIAIQMPFNFEHPSHVLADVVAKRLFPSVFGFEEPRSTLSVGRYAEILYKEGFKKQVARTEVYGHPMASGKEVLEWTKGTLLTAYQSRLSEEDFGRFFERYKEELLSAIGEGPYFYAFKRTFLWGRKTDA